MKSKKKHMMRRFLAYVLALVVIVGSIDMPSMSVQAAGKSSAKSVKLNYSMYTLKKGKKVTLKAKVNPKNAKNKKILWKSSKKKVASVSSKGVVKGLKNGKTTITATIKGTKLKATCKLIVGTPVKKVVVSSLKQMVIEVGKMASILAKVEPAKASNRGLTYLSSNPEIATVDAKGIVRGIKTGTVNITVKAKDGSNKKASVKVEVIESASVQEPESTPVQEPESTPVQKPESTPVQEPESTPAQEPESTPAQEPESTPTQEPESTPTQKPESTPTQKPESTPTQKPASTSSAAPSSKEFTVALYDGTTKIEEVKKEENYLLKDLSAPYQDGKIFLGWYYDQQLSQKVGQEDKLLRDLNLYASYGDATPLTEEGSSNFVSAIDVKKDFSIVMDAHSDTVKASDVSDALKLNNLSSTSQTDDNDAKEKEVLVAESLGNGKFSVSARGGFQEGATYKLEIAGSDRVPELTFDDCTKEVIYYNFTVAREEVLNVSLDDNLKYLSVSKLSDEDGEKVLAYSGLYQSKLDESGNQVYEATNAFGTFTYDENAYVPGDIVAIYEGEKPDNRDLTTQDNQEDSEVAYLEITEVKEKDGKAVYSYKSAQATDVLFTPDVLPIDIDEGDGVNGWSESGKDFTIESSKLNFVTGYEEIGLDYQTVVEAGDYIVFYSGDYGVDTMKRKGYGKITSVNEKGANTIVNYTVVTEEDVLASMDMYSRSEISEEQLDQIDTQLISSTVTDQVIKSGFAKEAGMHLANLAVKTDEVKDLLGEKNLSLKDCIITYQDGTPVAGDDIVLMGNVLSEGGEGKPEVSVNVSKKLEHFEKGTGVRVELAVKYSFDIQKTGSKKKIAIEMTAIFEDEILLHLSTSGGAIWKTWGVIPYIYDYEMTGNIDQGLYTGIAVTATAQLDEDEDPFGMELLKPEGLEDYGQKILDLGDSIQKMMEASKVMEPESEGSATGGLIEKYSNFVEGANDKWIDIVDVPILSVSGAVDPFYVLAYSFDADFVVSANLNVAIGMSFQYEKTQRQTFSLRLFNQNKSKCESVDLGEEYYQFDFYVMGTLGMRAGIRAKVLFGLFSTKLDGIGVQMEAGAYARLWGYFYYCLSWDKTKGKKSSATGAMYIEIGAYLDVNLCLEVLNGTFAFSPTLYSGEWPIWNVGEQENVLDFAYDEFEPTSFDMVRDTSMEVPSGVFDMKYLDLKEGGEGEKNYDANTRASKMPISSLYDDEKRFFIEVSKPFVYNPENNTISIVPEDGYYSYEGTLTITWKQPDTAYASKTLSRTFDVTWTDPEKGTCLIFNTNGGSLIRTQISNPNADITPVKNPTKVGYDFGGWYSDKELTQKTDVPTVMPNQDITLYAKWVPVPNQYKVLHKYEGLNKIYTTQNSVVQENDVRKNKRIYTDDVIDQEQIINDNKILKKGYEVDSVSTTKSAKIAADGSTVVTIYYKRMIHSVTYTMGDLKDDDNPDVVINYRYEEPIYSPNLFMLGYSFKGWDKTVSKTMDVEDLTYNAVWEPNSNTPYYLEYYVKDPSNDQYVMFGGKLGKVYKEGKTGESITVRDNLLKQEGYTFVKATVNGVDTNLSGKGVIDAHGRLTIRYFYQPISYDISYDMGGGTLISQAPDHYYKGTAINLNNIIAQKDGYDFAGWVESEEADQVLTEISSTRTGNIALIAKWKKKKNKINLYDEEESIGSVTATYGDIIPPLESIPTKDGYEFTGFYSADDILYYDKNGVGLILWEQVKDIKLNAKWTPGKVDISFDAAGGEAVDSMEGTFLSKYPALPSTTKTGYEFAGWTLDGALITDETRINQAKENVLVAKWKPAKNTIYMVECYVPSEDYTDENQEFELHHSALAFGETDSKVTVDTLEYSFPGYTFLKDHLDNNLSGKIAADGSTVFKLYFRENMKHSISFAYSTEDYKNSIENAFVLAATGTNITLPSYEDKSSHMEFIGWRKNGVFYKPESSYTVEDKDVDFVAQWRTKEFNVIYRNLDSGETFINVRYEYDTEFKVLPFMMTTPLQKNATTGKWEYKEFLGWSTRDEDGGRKYKPGDVLSDVGDLDLYAQWSDWKELPNGAYFVNNYIEDDSENNWKSFNTIQLGTVSEMTDVKAVNLPKNKAKEIEQKAIVALNEENEDSPIETVVKVTNELILLSISLDFNGGKYNGETSMSSKMKSGRNLFDFNSVEPVKEGYRFIGWSEYIPEYMEKHDINAEAQYEETGLYAVKINYLTENIDGSGYTGFASNVIYEKPGSFKLDKIPVFSGFTAQEAPTIIVEENDDNEYEIKYNRKSYTVTWDPGEGELAENSANTVSVKFGDNIPEGPALVRAGYAGTWKDIPSTMPAGDITITSSWTPRKVGYEVIYQYETVRGQYNTIVSYHREDAYAGTWIAPASDIPDSAGEKKELVAKGYVKPFPKVVMVAGDGSTKIYYKYNLIRSNLGYNLDGGETTTSNYAMPGVYRYGEVLQIPPLSQVKKEGYKAVGWYDITDSEQKVITDRTITIGENDVTYQMKWEKESYTITYDLNIDGATNKNNPTLYYMGHEFNISGAEKTGYAFSTWEWNGEGSMPAGVSIDNGVVHVTKEAKGNLSFKALWTVNYEEFVGLMDEESSELCKVNYPENTDPYIKDLPAPTRDGYVFAYWTKRVPAADSGYYTVNINDTTRVSTLNVNTDFVTAHWMKTSKMKNGSYSIHVNSELEWKKAVQILKSDPKYKGITVDSDFEIFELRTPTFETFEAGYVLDGAKHSITVRLLKDAIVGKNYGTITNLNIISGYINNIVENEESSFGVFARENYGVMSSCILGYNSNKLEWRIELKSNATYVGGIVGKNCGTVKSCCVRNVSVRSKNDELDKNSIVYLGGITGYNAQEGEVTYCSAKDVGLGCVAYALVASENQTIYLGGVAGKNVGLMSYTDVTNLFAGYKSAPEATTVGKLYVGGFAGIDEIYEQDVLEKNTRGIHNCSASGMLIYSDYIAGGIMAECNYTELKNNTLEDITVTANQYAGIIAGIYGYNNDVPGYIYISKAKVEAEVSGNACVIAGHGRNWGKDGAKNYFLSVRSNDNLTKVVNGGMIQTYNKGLFMSTFDSTMSDYYIDMKILVDKW